MEATCKGLDPRDIRRATKKAARKEANKEQVAAAYPVADTKRLPEDSTTYLDVRDLIFEDQDDPPGSQDIQEENQAMLRRQEQFRIAAKHVADSLSNIPEVQKAVLFGSVARPLEKEVPRFRKFRRPGIAISHECQDVDMAVWVSDLGCLKAVQKARSQALNNLLAETGMSLSLSIIHWLLTGLIPVILNYYEWLRKMNFLKPRAYLMRLNKKIR